MEGETHIGLNEGGFKKPVEKDPYELDDLVSNELAWSGRIAYFTVLYHRAPSLC